MRTMRDVFVLLLLACGLCVQAAPPEPREVRPLVVAITDNFRMPFVHHDGEEVFPEGIVFDFMEALGRRLAVEVRYIVLPRQRLRPAMQSGMAHVLPLANPKWYQGVEYLQWSPPWLADEDRFVVRAEDADRLQSLSDMADRKVGTILGYRYPEVEDLILRQDAKSLAQNLERLERHRLDAVIDSAILIRYHLRHDPGDMPLVLTPLVAGTSTRFLGLSKQAPVSIEAVSQAMQSMLDDGTVAMILARYR